MAKPSEPDNVDAAIDLATTIIRIGFGLTFGPARQRSRRGNNELRRDEDR